MPGTNRVVPGAVVRSGFTTGGNFMRTPLVVSTILTLTATGALAAGLTGSTAQAVIAPDTVPTKFAMRAAGYGSLAEGGQIPANSDTTAYQALSCTNRAGLDRHNNVASVAVPGLGELSQVDTRTWTTKRATTQGVEVASNSVNSIERITMGDASTGTLEINAITSRSRAFHNARGFHAKTATHIGSIDYTDATGAVQTFPIPTPDQPVETPLATLKVGNSNTHHSADHAGATANALVIESALTGTIARIARSTAHIDNGVKHGLFHGFSAASSAHGLDGNLKSGRNPLSLMPCQGTDGKEQVKSLVSLDVAPNIRLQGLSSRQQGEQTRTTASGFERSRVNVADLVSDAGDRLVINNVIGRANVMRSGNRVTTDTKGTDMGAVFLNGESLAFPESEKILEIPGVAKLEREIVTRYPSGLFVTALRVTLLDGSGAVLNLGQARLQIRDSGL